MPSYPGEAAGPAPSQPPPGSPPPSGSARSLRPAPGPLELVLVLGLVFALFLLVLLVSVALPAAGLRTSLVLTQALAFVVPPLLALRLFYLDGRAVLPFRRPEARHLVGAVLGILGLNHLLTIYAAWQERIWPQPESLRSMFDTLLAWNGPLDFVWLLVAVAVVPGACEEILFRGFVQSGLVRGSASAWGGVAGAAFLFAVFHLDPWRFVMVLALGLYLGWLRQASGSLWPAIMAHVLNNTLTIVLVSAGLAAADRSPGSVWTGPPAAALVLLALFCGRARPGSAADRML